MIPAKECDRCTEEADFSRHCGAFVCPAGHHVGMSSCYCGWSVSGGDGYRELVEAGETIEADDE